VLSGKHILYFTAEGHSLYRCARGKVELEASFTPDEEGVGQFKEHLRGARRGTLYALLADLAGEDFHEDQIPAVRGSDREAIVQRRLAQRYRDTRLAAALSLGTAEAGGRRNERILLASFTNTQQIAPWLDALDAAGARLAGVYSVPLAAPALAARLGVRTGRAFLITSNRAGLRQSFVEDGRLRFARLERTGEMSPQALAMFVRSETQRLAQYLSTLRVLPRNEGPVQVLVVAPPGQRAAFEQELVSDARLVFRTVDGSDAARAAGLSGAPREVLAEALYLSLVARKPPREQFANRADRRRFQIWRLQRAVVAAGLAGFVACTAVAGSRWLEAGDLRSRAEMQRRQGAAAADQYARITAYHMVKLGEFLAKLKDTPAGDGSLLDSSLIYFGAGMSNGLLHDRHNVPAALIGRANGRLAGNRHIEAPVDEPTSDLLLGMADVLGAEVETIGIAEGRLNLA